MHASGKWLKDCFESTGVGAESKLELLYVRAREKPGGCIIVKLSPPVLSNYHSILIDSYYSLLRDHKRTGGKREDDSLIPSDPFSSMI